MRICILTTTYPRVKEDAVGSFIEGQARALADAGHSVHIVVPHDPDAGSPHDQTEGNLHIHRFHYWLPHRWERLCFGAGIPENFRRNRLVALQLPTLIAGFLIRAMRFVKDCDVIHGHWLFGGISAWLLGWFMRKPVVVTLHGAEVLSPLLAAPNRFLAHRVDMLTVNSSFTANKLRLFAPYVQAAIIPFGVNAEKVAPAGFDRAEFRHQQGLEDEILILSVGRLVERKGFHVLLDAMARLPDDLPFKVMIGGSGPERPALEEQINRLGLRDRARLLGFVPDAALAQWYAAADLFVLPAIVDSSGDTEGLGMVLIEAMANGTPVIASQIGGIVDIVLDRETGLLVAPGNSEDLAEKLCVLARDLSLRQRLRQQALSHVQTNFSWETITARYYAVYQEVIS